MNEAAKAMNRRISDNRFSSRFFVGDGIDIGSAKGAINQYMELFPLVKSLRNWDIVDGDAQFMDGVEDESFDFVHSSHYLEHIHKPREAIENWIRIMKVGGHLVVTVPEANMYEQGIWPSRFNPDHKWVFTINTYIDWCNHHISIMEFMNTFPGLEIIKIEKLDHAFFKSPEWTGMDQTLNPITESAIEIVARRIK